MRAGWDSPASFSPPELCCALQIGPSLYPTPGWVIRVPTMCQACSGLPPIASLCFFLCSYAPLGLSPTSGHFCLPLSPLAQLTGSSRRGQGPPGLQSPASAHTGAWLWGGGHFLFMRTTGPPGAVPWTGLWSSPFSLDLSPPSGGPHISVQVPSSYGIQALPSLCAAGEGGKGGGVRSLQTARNVGVERPECPQEASPAPGPSPPQVWVYRPTFLLPLLL